MNFLMLIVIYIQIYNQMAMALSVFVLIEMLNALNSLSEYQSLLAMQTWKLYDYLVLYV